MAISVRHLIWAVLALLAVAAQAAQPVRTVTRFRVFAAKPIENLAWRNQDGSEELVKFSVSARSPYYVYRGAMPLRLVDSATSQIVAQADIPPSVTQPLLLLMESSQAGLPYRVMVLDENAASLRSGALTIVNLSGIKLVAALESKTLPIAEGLNAPAIISRPSKLVLSTESRGVRVQCYAETIPSLRNNRALLILFPPARKGGLEVQSRLLIDQPPGAAPPAPGKR